MRHLSFFLTLLPTLAFAEVPQGPPNANFEPAFENQTRAPALAKSELGVSVLADGLDRPWGIAVLPSGQFLVTEKTGQMRIVNLDGSVTGAISGVPDVAVSRQGGLLDVAISPRFSDDRLVFWTYAKQVRGGTVTAAARGELSNGGALTNVEDIFIQDPPSRSAMHYGSRILPQPDGTVWITTGEHSVASDAVKAQDNTTTYGKVIRLNWDGTAPSDNPFLNSDGVDSIWSFGHRNIQGAAMGPGGIWTIEHGPAGGDELNVPQAGRNYGWPLVSYGVNYDSSAVGTGRAVQAGTEQPIYYWDPVIAPAGMSFYDGPNAAWKGDLLIGSLNPGGLVRLKIRAGRVVGEERLLPDAGRVRDVEVLDDGRVILATDSGQLLEVIPK